MPTILLPSNPDANKGANERPAPSLTDLARVGGPPFVLMGAAAANFNFGASQSYTEAEQVIVSSFLFGAGVFAWLLGMILDYKRWKVFLDTNAQREATAIEAICRLMESRDRETARELIQIILRHSSSFATPSTAGDNALPSSNALEYPNQAITESAGPSKTREAGQTQPSQ